ACLPTHAGAPLAAVTPSTDSIAVTYTKTLKLIETLHDALPAGPSEGCTPNALALSADEKRLYVAEADANAVAVFDVASGKLLGRVPTEWYPTALAVAGNEVIVVNGKGAGTAPNPKRLQPDQRGPVGRQHTLGQLDGSVMSFPASIALDKLTARVAKANGWTRTRPARVYPPFKHVVYIIKENRTYDQVLGDVAQADG